MQQLQQLTIGDMLIIFLVAGLLAFGANLIRNQSLIIISKQELKNLRWELSNILQVLWQISWQRILVFLLIDQLKATVLSDAAFCGNLNKPSLFLLVWFCDLGAFR